MGKAKTASKNNPTTRKKAKIFSYNGKDIKPCKYVGENSTYMAAVYDDGNLVEDANGDPVPWGDLV